jgi:signal transduction histidine kinase
VSAGGRWLGVIFADRGGGNFTLTEPERHTMWTLGRTAALAASARIATSQQDRARLLDARIALARDIHERVVQRLFGISLVLGAERDLSHEERARCNEELQAALSDLREALARPLSPPPQEASGPRLADELRRLGRHYKDLPLEVDWEHGVEVPPAGDSLAQSVLAEALRNADKHAQPSRVSVHVGRSDGTFVLDVRNDGVPAESARTRRPGMGLRLAGLEALKLGGVVEFGRDSDEWRVRLVVPVREEAPA